MKIAERSAGVILYKMQGIEPHFLLLLHTEGDHWGFPKGKIEGSETVKEAAIRELYEETGIHVDINTLSNHFFEDYYDIEIGKKQVKYFLAIIDKEGINLSVEHSDYAWCNYVEEKNRIGFANSIQILTQVNDFILDNIQN